MNWSVPSAMLLDHCSVWHQSSTASTTSGQRSSAFTWDSQALSARPRWTFLG